MASVGWSHPSGHSEARLRDNCLTNAQWPEAKLETIEELREFFPTLVRAFELAVERDVPSDSQGEASRSDARCGNLYCVNGLANREPEGKLLISGIILCKGYPGPAFYEGKLESSGEVDGETGEMQALSSTVGACCILNQFRVSG